jgi:hypothetical protein
MSEAQLQAEARVLASKLGAIVYRNNVGSWLDKNGRKVAYGVCNPGGSDLIGIMPIKVTQEMVGSTIGRFVAIEIKDAGKKPTKDQEMFLNIIKNNGGIAGYIDDISQLVSLLS